MNITLSEKSKLILILLLALALRLALWSQPLHQPANDEKEYVTVAYDLLEGRGWQLYEHYHWLRAPLYPLFLAGSLWLSGGNLHLAALPNTAVSVATVYLVYLLTAMLLQGIPGIPISGKDCISRKDAKTQRPDEDSDSMYPPERQNTRYEGDESLSPSPSRAPLLAALCAALLFTFNTFASLYMSETLWTFLFTASLIMLLKARIIYRQQCHINRKERNERKEPDKGPCHLWVNSSVHRWLACCGGYALIGSGVLYGLATLTRSVSLAFLPVVVVWLVADRLIPVGLKDMIARTGAQTHRPDKEPSSLYPSSSVMRSILAAVGLAVLFVGSVALTIAPWTVRNCRAYGRCILVETGLSYNLWAFSEPREGMGEIFRTLERIPNPAERADEATRRGLERLQEDPAILLRKLWPNWATLWRIKPIEDRFLLPTYYADPPPLVFLAALVLDDLLYVLILLASVIGLLRLLAYRHTRMTAILLALWIMYIVATTMLTHGEGRYRHFIFPIVIAFAMTGVARWGRVHPYLALPVVLLWIVLLVPIGTLYPWEWATGGAVRSLYRIAGDAAWQMGMVDRAEAAYLRAYAAQKTSDGRLLLGDLYRSQGDMAQAEHAYRAGWSRQRRYAAANARLGNVLRDQGRVDEARKAFEGYFVAEHEVTDWSWAHLDPVPASFVDVGDGLDFGYVGGVYNAEVVDDTTARWTQGTAMLRLSTLPFTNTGTSASTTQMLTSLVLDIRLAAPYPDADEVQVEICSGTWCQSVAVARGWQRQRLLVPLHEQPSQVIEIRSPTFTAADGRDLGVLLDWARATPCSYDWAE